MILKHAGLIILSYLIGAIPSGYLIVRAAKGIDVRDYGSGNIGFANVVRTAGPFWGGVVLVADAGKAFLAVSFFRRAFENPSLFGLLLSLAVVAGNVLNPFLGFRGGKGVGTGLGAAAAMSPVPLAFSVGAFGVTLAAARFVSLGSLVASGVFLALNVAAFLRPGGEIFTLIFAGLLFAVVFVRHIPNMKRLLKGEETKL